MNQIATQDSAHAERFLRALIAWFPRADPEPAWMDQAIRMLRPLTVQVMTRMHQIGQRELKGFPSIPALHALMQQAIEEARYDGLQSNKDRTANATRLMPVLVRQFWARHQQAIKPIIAHGYGAYFLSEIEAEAWRCAQVDREVEWPQKLEEKIMGWKPHSNPPEFVVPR